MFSKFAFPVSLLAVTSQVAAQLGNTVIQNQCSSNVYMAFTTNVQEATVVIAPGQSVTNPYTTNPDGGGISIKLATSDNFWNGAPITQLEYTLGSSAFPFVFYDMSNINGYPFQDQGLTLTPSDSSCRVIDCAPGVQCAAAYNQPDDNFATASCALSSVMTLVLCSGNNAPAASSAAPASSSAPTPAQQLAPTSTSTSTPPPPPPTTTSTSSSSSSTPPPPPPTTTSTSSTSTSTTSSSSSTPPPPPPTTTSSSTTSIPTTAVPTTTVVTVDGGIKTTIVGYVTTTFVTEVKTIYATPAPAAPTDVSKRERAGEQGARKGRIHRHHHHHHAESDN